MANRLAGASSPYLEQHKDNPVDWWPWCPEAFEEAAARDLPVLVSVGYAACHWCHVMAHESFEDPEVAEALNKNFVAIKVDREERPDVDAVYMTATQAMTGQPVGRGGTGPGRGQPRQRLRRAVRRLRRGAEVPTAHAAAVLAAPPPAH